MMGSGYGGIYKGTFGDRWVNGSELNVVAPAIRSLTPAQIAAVSAALGGLLVLDEIGLPDFATTYAQLEDSIREAVGSGSMEGLPAPTVDEPMTTDSGIAWLAAAVLSVRLLTWAASKAQELGIDAGLDDDGEPTGIYENCKVAEAALSALYPGEVPGAHEGEVTTRFTFHEEGGAGGHFGMNDEPDNIERKGIPSRKVYVVEYCSAIGGRFAPAVALFLLLGRGGELKPLMDERQGGTGLPTGNGMRVRLKDGSNVVYRWDTKTSTSSAVEVSRSADARVANHKVHFFEEGSKRRKLQPKAAQLEGGDDARKTRIH